MNALLVESHPLLRLGLLQMLERIEGIDQVVTVDPADLSHLDSHYADTDLLIFGMPADADAGWRWLSEARRVVAAQRVLLLSEVVPIQIPAEVMAQGVCGCLPKSASLAVLEAAIRLAIVGGYFVRGHHAAQLPTFPGRHATVTGGPVGAMPPAAPGRVATLPPATAIPIQHAGAIPAGRAAVAPLLYMLVNTVRTSTECASRKRASPAIQLTLLRANWCSNTSTS